MVMSYIRVMMRAFIHFQYANNYYALSCRYYDSSGVFCGLHSVYDMVAQNAKPRFISGFII